ncbi:uncharacterized protein G2W53_002257 [Senna tora]|uniref:Uncharacterized protein n=1 Tax=Senna tora TaxID=362788 RepID=A0A834XHS8_9FABA|nr:uncharacterized protein G2W53_002257 [Senna tora]
MEKQERSTNNIMSEEEDNGRSS